MSFMNYLRFFKNVSSDFMCESIGLWILFCDYTENIQILFKKEECLAFPHELPDTEHQ